MYEVVKDISSHLKLRDFAHMLQENNLTCKILEVKDTKITVSFTARNKEAYEKLKEMIENS
jgi:hypothetical protein